MSTGMTDIDGRTFFFDWNGYLQKGFVRTVKPTEEEDDL